ncbi:hypothetical protein GCM10007096_34530 [Pullulanibacillus pueri]|uniref:Uncharacterized protein n=1 Tax=Pullulanibacillus pueri TaxID=1437324 RepID=A0A8J3ENH7_9BACL|nr:hypothetical protein GCM10007096_34530 [Pullulanibacillus pueri]
MGFCIYIVIIKEITGKVTAVGLPLTEKKRHLVKYADKHLLDQKILSLIDFVLTEKYASL